ncbi:subtilisin-like protease SBT3 [Zingiber officinale]|uniref:subtilisin-like protease SBT3 n=1 Tax=Zingiber officinale TaxID=94328 RepID=UPI001C4ACD24|nr:subtilisin-like protease SBT3 [Zingiber officinale]
MANSCGRLLWLGALVIVSTITTTSADDVATYIIHMDSAAMPAAFSDRRSWYLATLAAAISGSSAVGDRILYVYEHAVHGFSARFSQAQLARLKQSRGFLACHVDALVKKDTTHTPAFLGLTADGAGLWPVSRFGDDAIIGVVDTGVWPESASFSDDSLGPVPPRWRGACEIGPGFGPSACNRKLIGARSFFKGLLALDPNLTLPDPTPRDDEGHGTHTSSTAGGSRADGAAFFGYSPGKATGVAPWARLAMYKALWSGFGGATSDIIAAVDKAIADGVDVISLSLGIDDLALYQDPIAIATFAAVDQGIFVSTSAGNEGPFDGLLHNGTPWVTTVGASTVDRTFVAAVTLGEGSVVLGQSLYPGSSASKHRQLPLVFLDQCDNITLLKNNRHKIVICKVAELGIAVQNLQIAKVDAGLFISGDIFLEFYIQFTYPAAIISPQDGPTILNYINNTSEPKAMLRFKQTVLGTKPAPVVATYSSRGPSSSCPSVLKPDIVAPGSLILAAWPTNSSVGVADGNQLYSQFNIISGTSMACPHVAGVGALLKAARPEWSPAAIRSAIMTTASHLDNTGAPIKDMGHHYKHATPLAMGSGHLDPNRALEPGLIYDADTEDYLELLCAMNFTIPQIKIIAKTTSIDCSNATLDLNYPSFIAYFDANATSAGSSGGAAARQFRRRVTNVGDPTATYRAEIVQIKGFTTSVVPERLVFTERYEKQSFTLILEKVSGRKADTESHGSLSWVEEKGKYVVRSPIVGTTFIPGL